MAKREETALPQNASVHVAKDVWRLLYLKLRKHFIEKYFFDDVDLLITREKWFLSSDNSGVIVVKCTRLFNHLLISITGAQRPFMTTGKQWNQLSANFKDVKLCLKNHIMLPTRPDKGWRHALLHPWKVKFLSINGLLTIK